MIKAPDVTLIYVIVAFLISYAIFKKFLFAPLAAILDERAAEEKAAEKVYAESLEGLSRAIARAEEEMARARREALKQRETLRTEGRAHLDKKLQAARASAQETLEKAGQEIDAEAARCSAELPRGARQLARDLAEKILGRKLAA
jgi:F-type H+-transporting ATPase subunit b